MSAVRLSCGLSRHNPLTCSPSCGGEMRVLAFLTDPPVVRTILVHLDLPPPVSSARGPPQTDLLLDQTPQFDPAEPRAGIGLRLRPVRARRVRLRSLSSPPTRLLTYGHPPPPIRTSRRPVPTRADRATPFPISPLTQAERSALSRPGRPPPTSPLPPEGL